MDSTILIKSLGGFKSSHGRTGVVRLRTYVTSGLLNSAGCIVFIAALTVGRSSRRSSYRVADLETQPMFCIQPIVCVR